MAKEAKRAAAPSGAKKVPYVVRRKDVVGRNAPARPAGRPARPLAVTPTPILALPVDDRVDPASEGRVLAARTVDEPVWLVRIVILLFLVGFAAFMAREVSNFMRSL